MADDDLKTLVRDFRTSVAQGLEAQHQRIDRLADKLRSRYDARSHASKRSISARCSPVSTACGW